MKTVLNFSHPLSQEAKKIFREKFGVEKEIHTPFQLDLQKSIYDQTLEIFEQVLRTGEVNEEALVILPGYSPAASILATLFKKKFGTVTVAILTKIPGKVPPTFVPSQVFTL